jgi:hypothetical protein
VLELAFVIERSDFFSSFRNPLLYPAELRAQNTVNKTLTENNVEQLKQNLASILAFLSENLPDLALIVKRWPELPEHIKQTIRTLVETTGE